LAIHSAVGCVVAANQRICRRHASASQQGDDDGVDNGPDSSTAPLEKTLNELIDVDLLNSCTPRPDEVGMARRRPLAVNRRTKLTWSPASGDVARFGGR
jgi:hypothetical protein